MSKEFKVHEDFNLEHLSWDEENCHCDKPGREKEAKYLNCESSRHYYSIYQAHQLKISHFCFR